MKCPDEIARILLEILSVAALNIRAAGYAGDAKRCHAEADHVHNLPSLLQDYWPEGLDYYWRHQRSNFVGQSGAYNIRQFETLWDQLKPFVEGID